MQEDTKSQQNRNRRKFYQILLLLLPGMIFLTLYPVHYREALEKAAQEILKDPKTWPPDTMPDQCRILAGTRTGIILVSGMALCAVIVSFTQPTTRKMIRKALLALAFMTAVNIVFCGGGFALGHHTNRPLEEAIGRIRRTPLPERAKFPPPQVQKP